jgi:O-antigen/teichoic acid export membrane protein
MLRKLVDKKINLSQSNSLKDRLVKATIGSFGLKVSATALAFFLTFLFTQLLGSEGLGTYSYATTWANILSIPATLGLDNLLVREIAIYEAQSSWGLMKGILSWSNRIVLVISVTFAVVAAVTAWVLKGTSDPAIATAICLALITLPISSLRNLRLATMKGLHHIVKGQMPEMLFSPLLLILSMVGLYWLLPKYFNVNIVLVAKIAIVIFTYIIGVVWLWQALPKQVKNVAPQYEVRRWMRSALPFMFLGTIILINSRVDIVMLGILDGVKAVGIYTVIAGISQCVTFVYYSANNSFAPSMAGLYAQGNIEQLQRVINKSVGLVFLASAIVSAILIGFSHWILLIFGAEFTTGQTAMIILIVGQLLHAMHGPAGILLDMTGHEKYTAIAAGSSAILNICLNALLIPHWGINGAATATTISLIMVNIADIILVRTKLKLSVTLFGSIKS